ncbi:MAG: phosphotransferase [Treponema sp.]|jgi:5-methylthioribose kinase|nr:phosphotransferase [Treponema sp.]
MKYRDLDPGLVKTYVAGETSLFPKNAELTVTEIGRNEIDGDGYVNYVYRIQDGTGHSVILKQAKPYLKHLGKGVAPLPEDRVWSEVDINLLRETIVPQYIPRMLHVDRENYLYIAEDCGRLGIMRFGLSRGRRYPEFPRMMGEFMAKCNFYTSELYLDQGVHKELGRRFTSPEMSRIMEIILFLRESFVEDYKDEPEPGHKAISDCFWDKREARIELLKLRDVYMKKQECLVHGDLHTSNTMIAPGPGGDMKIIDMEYTHLGPFSSDSGYLLGNLVYTYVTWFYHDEWNGPERSRYREEILGYIAGVLSEYARIFRECWDRDVKATFRPYPEYREDLLRTYLRETAGFMGSQICARTGAFAETFDFDVLPDLDKRNRARALAMTIAYALIMRRDDAQSPGDITGLIRRCAEDFHRRVP